MEAILTKILLEARSKSLAFTKENALDQLLNLKVVAMEGKHEKAGYYAAVFQALKEKMSAPEDQFKRYLIVLLGDKEEEKVHEKLAKIDKSYRRQSQPRQFRPYNNWQPQGGSMIRCFACRRYGHFQRNCPMGPRESFPQGRRGNRGRWGPSTESLPGPSSHN